MGCYFLFRFIPCFILYRSLSLSLCHAPKTPYRIYFFLSTLGIYTFPFRSAIYVLKLCSNSLIRENSLEPVYVLSFSILVQQFQFLYILAFKPKMPTFPSRKFPPDQIVRKCYVLYTPFCFLLVLVDFFPRLFSNLI